MTYSVDSDLVEYQPDILDLGITAFTNLHAMAKSDIDRELLSKWFLPRNTGTEFDSSLLTATQFKVASVYLVLWKYALPQLTNWVGDDRFISMIDFYKLRYNEEMSDILAAGVEYDEDEDGVITSTEKRVTGAGYLAR